MTEERGALIEAIARALLSSATIAGKWERLSEIALEIYRIDADVALTAISNAGFAVVPKTVTPRLLDALDDEAPAVGCCIMDRHTADYPVGKWKTDLQKFLADRYRNNFLEAKA